MRSVGASHIGKVRSENQDEIFFSDQPIGKLNNLYIVADGMGGHRAGGYASSYTVERFVELLEKSEEDDMIESMKSAIAVVNREILEKCKKEPDFAGMGTTIVAAVVTGSLITVMNIGDSRLYYAGKKLQQITTDHSYVEELVKAGALRRDQSRLHPKKNLITRAVGATSAEPDFFQFEAQEGYLLLCSDGLTNMMADEEIGELLLDHCQLEQKPGQMITRANEYGGNDNISVVIVDLKK